MIPHLMVPMPRVYATTRTNTVYRIDDEHNTWWRMRRGNDGIIKVEHGGFIQREPIILGMAIVMECPPLNIGGNPRLIMTSPVKMVSNISPMVNTYVPAESL